GVNGDRLEPAGDPALQVEDRHLRVAEQVVDGRRHILVVQVEAAGFEVLYGDGAAEVSALVLDRAGQALEGDRPDDEVGGDAQPLVLGRRSLGQAVGQRSLPGPGSERGEVV